MAKTCARCFPGTPAPVIRADGPVKRAGALLDARLFSPHVRFTDHTDEEWKAARYAVVSVDSVIAFVKAKDQGLAETHLRPSGLQASN